MASGLCAMNIAHSPHRRGEWGHSCTPARGTSGLQECPFVFRPSSQASLPARTRARGAAGKQAHLWGNGAGHSVAPTENLRRHARLQARPLAGTPEGGVTTDAEKPSLPADSRLCRRPGNALAPRLRRSGAAGHCRRTNGASWPSWAAAEGSPSWAACRRRPGDYGSRSLEMCLSKIG